MPDLVTNFRYKASSWHAQASFFLGEARFRPKEGNNDDVTLWGGLLSAKTKTFGRDNVYGQFTFGDGVGRYRGGVTAVPDANNQLHAVGLNAFMGGYEHFWSSRYSSNLIYSVVTAPDKSFYPDTLNKRLDYGAVKSPLLVLAGPRVGRRRVSLRPPRGHGRRHRDRPSASVRDSLQPPVVGTTWAA